VTGPARLRPARRARLAAAALLVAVAAAALAASGSASPGAGARRPPNVLLILADDQAMNTFTPRLMPDTYSWIVDPGTKFTAGLAAPPLCCPDRAGILTGQYPHNDRVFSNDPGYPTLRQKADTLPVWLGRAGYRTGFVGKFLNGYVDDAGYAPAPGFDSWFAYDASLSYLDYTVSEGGQPRSFGSGRGDYSTDVFTAAALRFLRSPSPKPFFLWLAYNAPHDSHVAVPHCDSFDPLPPDEASYLRFSHLHLPRPPSFNEADVSDKPAAIASMALLDKPHVGYVIRRYRCTAAALGEVDRGINRIMHALRHRGELRHTIVFYLSDNGYFFGEHRIDFGKSYPYEPALRVPYAVRIPAVYRRGPPPRSTAEVVSNQDVAPTILDYAGGVDSCAAPHRCRTLDGRSLRPLLSGNGRWPRDRGVLAELDDAGIDYATIRTPDYAYTRYADGERELYDLERDPFELRNVAGDRAYAAPEASLAQRLAALRRCKGTRGPRACE
jgi:N-acetylglucosamine-6-sulfatase